MIRKENMETTFYKDFTIADMFGEEGIQDTYNRAFEGWKTDYQYLTELVITLNHKIWEWYEKDEKIARLYDRLWREADGWALDNLKGDELKYFIKQTD